MHVFGLHILDLLVVVFFLCGVISLGWWSARGVKEEKDFYLGGRKLGRTLQFFLNFGNLTDASGAPTTAAEVFRQGVGGIWISLQTLFITPFYWFSATWFRRVRLVTMADLFVERLNSKSLATAYVLFNIYVSLLLLGFGNVVSYKVAAAMMVKPSSEYTQTEQVMVNDYADYSRLKAAYLGGKLPLDEKDRFELLDGKIKRGQINSFVSYVKPLPFYIFYTVVVALYITLGGLKAAAVTDALQGLLILFFTILMIPLGLMKVGGLRVLHQSVPEYMFRLFGTVAASDYAWYSILAITFTSMIQIFGLSGNMANSGSAKDEETARFGQITGAFAKRMVIIAWMFCGLLAVALFPGGLADPENIWGIMSKSLLGPGLMGLMLSGMLLGHMPAIGSNAIAVSALIARNIYEPLVTGKTEQHYLRVGQTLVVLTLAVSIVSSMLFSGAVKLITTIITFNAFFGAVVLLIFFWRRLTARAVWASLGIWIVLIGIVPALIPTFESARRGSTFVEMTRERNVTALMGASAEDVAAGLASKTGQSIAKSISVPPVAIFFESVVHSDANESSSPLEGVGRFQVEAYLLHLAGVPVRQFNKAGLLGARWAVDGLLPFLLLMVSSYLLPDRQRTAADLLRVDRFFAKMKTPVASTPEQDEREIELSYREPHRFDAKKLWPSSQWEFTRWVAADFIGFSACWVVVAAIVGILWLVVNIGR